MATLLRWAAARGKSFRWEGLGRVQGLILVAVAGALLLGINLGGYRLWDPDEAEHAEIAREMLVTGRWLEPVVNFVPYHHKPSVLYLLVGLSYRLFGVNELAARFVPALACWLTLLAVYWYVSAKSTRSGLLATLLLAASGFFVFVGRFTNFDGLITMTLTLAVFALARWREHRQPRPAPTAFYLLVGTGVLVKGPMAGVLLAVPVVFLLLKGEASIAELRVGRGIGIVTMVTAAWAIPVGLLYPHYLLDFVWIHNVQRFLPTGASFHTQPFYFFVPVVAGALLPWSPLLLHGLRHAFAQRGGERLLAVYGLWVVLFFSISSGKLPTYVLPAFPAFAVVVASWLESCGQNPPAVARKLVHIGAALASLVPLAALVLLRKEAPTFQMHALVFLPASLAGLFTLWRARKHPLGLVQAMVLLCSGMVASLFAFNLFTAPAVSRYTGDYDLALAGKAEGRPERVIAYGVRPYSFLFYTQWPMTYRVGDDAIRRALGRPGKVLVLTKDRWLAELRALAPGLVLHEVARNRRHILFSVGHGGR